MLDSSTFQDLASLPLHQNCDHPAVMNPKKCATVCNINKNLLSVDYAVVALAAYPELMSSSDIPADVKGRVREILGDCSQSSVGSYSPSGGLRMVREAVAAYLTERDQAPARAQDIYLGNGAADLIRAVLAMFIGDIDGKPPAVMLPIPQYPLFSGFLSELGLLQASYYLDEERNWALDTCELQRCWKQASICSHVRVLVIINPGNPSGQVLSVKDLEEIVKFAYDHDLFLLADEVYQDNIIGKKFHSLKKAMNNIIRVMYAMGEPYRSMELASFATCSKGWAAESGLRAGFLEMVGVQGGVAAVFERTRSLLQCPGVLGQCALHCLVQPPLPGEPSYERYKSERGPTEIALAERSATAFNVFNSIPGYSCNSIHGAVFAFPRVEIPKRAQKEALENGRNPDEFYCLQLLEETGVCVVPGSGFGQREGTFHFRTTILHPPREFNYMMESIRRFHLHFLQRYSN
ncbi:unnamed protein product, partial [Iphiclides podalirius]